MEWVMRQVCFSLFVLSAGLLLHAGWMREGGQRIVDRSLQLSVPILLYAAAELCCYGRGAAVLLPIRMLELLYGFCLFVGLSALARLFGRKKLRRVLQTAVFPFTVLETALLGFVLLRDGYCRSEAAAVWGVIGMIAAILLLLVGAFGQNFVEHVRGSAR